MKRVYYLLTLIILSAVTAFADDVPYRQQRRDEEATGLKSSLEQEATYTSFTGKNYVDRMLGTYSLLPVTSADVLMLGDGLVQQGEWAELFGGNAKVDATEQETTFGTFSLTGNSPCNIDWMGLVVPQSCQLQTITFRLPTTGTTRDVYAVLASANDVTASSTGNIIAYSTNKTGAVSCSGQTITYTFEGVNVEAATYYLYFSSTTDTYTADTQRMILQSGTTYTPALYFGSKNHTDYTPVFQVVGGPQNKEEDEGEKGPSLTLNTSHPNLGHLLPQPQSVTFSGAAFALGRGVDLMGDESLLQETAVQRYMQAAGLTIDATSQAKVMLHKVSSIPGAFDHQVADFDNEAYALVVDGNRLDVYAVTRTGVIRAMQTLEQLLRDEPTQVPGMEVVDWPAFKIRGYMHDIGRSYISTEELKQEIDLLSRFKENVFFWHLTDKQAFRFESKLVPKVNTGFTRMAGADKYYTQEQCREIQDYAWERGITIIPEIDMPGHSAQFTSAMGYSMASDEGKADLKLILGELVQTFDKAPYIHIGGDETADATLEYINEMADVVRDMGRKVVVWNCYGRPFKKVDPTTLHVDMCTNWGSSGTLSSGIPNIDMRYNYINHFDMWGDLAGIYRSNIFYVQRGTNDVGGTITGMWNDRLISDEALIIKENNFYANALASAERAWKGGGKQYVETGGAYLPNSGEEYDEFCDWESRFIFHKATTLKAVESRIPYVRQTHMRWNLTKAYSNGGDGSKAFDVETATALTPQPGDKTITGAGAWLNHVWAGTIAGVLGKTAQTSGQTRYAWTYVYSPKAQTVGAQIQTYDYSRSQMGSAPANGTWDNRKSQVWVNDEEILPNVDWTTAGNGEETELGNVNFTARQPIQVQLKAGWNKVVLKLPFVASGISHYANKWQFTFVFTDPEGINAVEGLIYNPNQSMDGAFVETVPTPPFEVDSKKVYTLRSSRGSKYVTCSAKESTLTGNATLVTDGSAYWSIQWREDGLYDIINYLYGGRIKADGVSSGSAMSTSATSPATGWEFKPSAVDAWSVIVGSSNQFNQSNQTNVLNWGGGTNTTDAGCLYQIEEVDGLLVGDITNDARVTINDMSVLTRKLNEGDDYSKEADINLDGVCDIDDTKALERIIIDD